jgi:hypothetical protein
MRQSVAGKLLAAPRMVVPPAAVRRPQAADRYDPSVHLFRCARFFRDDAPAAWTGRKHKQVADNEYVHHPALRYQPYQRQVAPGACMPASTGTTASTRTAFRPGPRRQQSRRAEQTMPFSRVRLSGRSCTAPGHVEHHCVGRSGCGRWPGTEISARHQQFEEHPVSGLILLISKTVRCWRQRLGDEVTVRTGRRQTSAAT